MPPRKRGSRAAVVETAPEPTTTELDELEEPTPEPSPKNRRRGNRQEPTPDLSVVEEEDTSDSAMGDDSPSENAEDTSAAQEMTDLLHMLRQSTGILIDEQGLEMALTVAEWWRHNHNRLSAPESADDSDYEDLDENTDDDFSDLDDDEGDDLDEL